MDSIPEDRQIYIDLGKVMVMAKVKLNGEYVGGVWTAPYSLNVSKYIKEGENKLEIEVVNNWYNKMLELKSENAATSNVGSAKVVAPLQSSGLLGPVEVKAYDYQVK